MSNLLEIYTEYTPNPESLKFVTNRMLLPGDSADFDSAENAGDSPLALALFELPFVNRVFINNNYVSVTKSVKKEWIDLKNEVQEIIANHINAGKSIIESSYSATNGNEITEEDSELVKGIKQSLEQYVKPAVEMDGGAIQFKEYDEGKVTVMLQGSCSGCPSSMVTLKAGIEGLLKRLHPEVQEVVAEEA